MAHRLTVISTAVLALLPGVALAQSLGRPVVDPPIRTLPMVIEPLSPEALKRFRPWPSPDTVGGSATIRCITHADWILTDCVVLREEPAGYGFGLAALHAARFIPVAPGTLDGVPVEDPIEIELVFPPLR